MRWMFLPLARCFDFSGRSRRLEFWLFMLFQFIVCAIVLGIFFALYWDRVWDLFRGYAGSLDGYGAYGSAGPRYAFDPQYLLSDLYRAVGPAAVGMLIGLWVFGLLLLIPNLAVSIRRLHDGNRTGWWVLAPSVPYFFSTLFAVLGMTISGDGFVAMSILSGVFGLAGFVLAITFLVLMFLDGTPGTNRFGPDPKARNRTHGYPGYPQPVAGTRPPY